MILKIRRRTQLEWLVLLLILMPCAFALLNDLLMLPRTVRYLLDLVWMLLLAVIVVHRTELSWKNMQMLLAWVLLFLVYTILVYFVQYQSAAYYLWGVRNNFRFYVAFFAFALFLNRQAIADIFAILEKLFWINLVVTLIQFFALGLEQDFLGGIFGTEKGCNGYTNIFLAIIVSQSVVFYLEKQESASKCAAKCIAALLIAALAELKFFFAEFVVIIALAIVFTNFSWRKFWLAIGSVAAVFAGAALLVAIFPAFADFFSVAWFLETGSSDTGYASAGDLNRLNAISQINERWLKSSWERIFGLGLGNCDYASFDFLRTPFFMKYEDTHYTWLSYAFMYLECGWIGLVLYFGFFVCAYLRICKIEKKSSGITKTYCNMVRIVAILCLVIAVYNSSLRTEAAYMAYFVLAIPFALDKSPYRTIRE